MPVSSRMRARRLTRALLLSGALLILSCWSWVMFSLPSLLPPHLHSPPITLPPLSIDNNAPSSPVSDKRKFGSSDERTRHLSNSMNNRTDGNKNDSINNQHLRARHHAPADPQPQQQRTPSNLDNDQQSAPTDRPPITSLIYPLHAKSGTHHAYLYVGTPPQRQTLIVDTGSRLTAFPCSPHCPDCGEHASEQFQPDASASHGVVPCDECQLSRSDYPLEDYFGGDGVGGNSGDGGPGGLGLRRGVGSGLENNKGNSIQQPERRGLIPESCVNGRCEIDQRYTEGSSWKAFEVKDKVWLGLDAHETSAAEHNNYSAPFVLGCQVSEQGLFKTQYADGIMGLSMYTQTLVGTWHQHGSTPRESFSLCMNREGGHIALGGIGSLAAASASISGGGGRQEEYADGAGRHLAPMRFTPFAKGNSWYYTVTVTSVSVGEHVLPTSILQYVNDFKGTIVDSGTTDTFISHKVAGPFISAWEKITGRQYHNRVQKYTCEQFGQLPVITFELEGGVRWEVRPEAYMEAQVFDNNENAYDDPVGRWEGTRRFISRVYVDEPHGVVLGSNAMMDKEIYFDITNKRLGVVKATCVY